MNITKNLETIEDELNDAEVYFYMIEHIKNDVCLCKKYGKPSKRKPCPVCNEYNYATEPKKKQQRKYSRAPSGNTGRTGCLKKPGLCSIPEHDILTDFSFEQTPNLRVTARTKMLNRYLKKILNASEYKHKWTGSNILADYKTEASTKISENTSSRGTMIPNVTDEDRSRLKGTSGCRLSMNAREEWYGNCPKSDSRKSSSNKRNEQECSFWQDSDKSGDAKRCYNGEGEKNVRWKKPKLIPARDFLKRYYPLPPINSKSRKTESHESLGNGSHTNEVFANTKKEGSKLFSVSDDVSNITDDQKLINALSRITIKPSVIEKGNSK